MALSALPPIQYHKVSRKIKRRRPHLFHLVAPLLSMIAFKWISSPSLSIANPLFLNRLNVPL